jgi:type I restriction enzyme S subunit
MVTIYRSISNGIRPSQWRLEPDLFLGLVIFIPPASEQREVVAFVTNQTTRFDALGSEAQRAIDLLQERRTALISAAVTGKIDVRGLAETEAA